MLRTQVEATCATRVCSAEIFCDADHPPPFELASMEVGLCTTSERDRRSAEAWNHRGKLGGENANATTETSSERGVFAAGDRRPAKRRI